MQIGSVNVETPFSLAPMAGYTDAAFRSLCRDFGCGMLYTEVVVAQGLMRDSKPSWHLLETVAGERPIAAHIYGADPDVMARAAARIERCGRFDLIDINCGCPVRKIVAKGAGAALIRKPEQIGRIVQAVGATVAMPVTVKTRIGFDPGEARIREIAHAVEEAGAAAIAIHGRYAAHHHKGEANWDLIARIKAERSIPVIGNGGIWSAADAWKRLRESGVDDVMIARGAVGRPWIFEDIVRLARGAEPRRRTLPELRDIMREHLNRLVALKSIEAQHRRKSRFDPDRSAAMQFRCHLVQYLSGFSDWADIRRRLNHLTSTADVLDIVDQVFARQSSNVVTDRSHGKRV